MNLKHLFTLLLFVSPLSTNFSHISSNYKNNVKTSINSSKKAMALTPAKKISNKGKVFNNISTVQSENKKKGIETKNFEGVLHKNATIHLKSSSLFSYSIHYKSWVKNSDGSLSLKTKTKVVDVKSKNNVITGSFFNINSLIMHVNLAGQKDTKFTFVNNTVLGKLIKSKFKNDANPSFNLNVSGALTNPKTSLNYISKNGAKDVKPTAVGSFKIESAASWWAANSILMNFIITVLCIAFLALGGPTISLFVLKGATMPDGGSITSVEDAIKADPVTNNPEVTNEENQYNAPSEGRVSNSPPVSTSISGENSSGINEAPVERGTVVNHTIERGGPATQFLTTAENPFANPDINDAHQGTDHLSKNQQNVAVEVHPSSGDSGVDSKDKSISSKPSVSTEYYLPDPSSIDGGLGSANTMEMPAGPNSDVKLNFYELLNNSQSVEINENSLPDQKIVIEDSVSKASVENPNGLVNDGIAKSKTPPQVLIKGLTKEQIDFDLVRSGKILNGESGPANAGEKADMDIASRYLRENFGDPDDTAEYRRSPVFLEDDAYYNGELSDSITVPAPTLDSNVEVSNDTVNDSWITRKFDTKEFDDKQISNFNRRLGRSWGRHDAFWDDILTHNNAEYGDAGADFSRPSEAVNPNEKVTLLELPKDRAEAASGDAKIAKGQILSKNTFRKEYPGLLKPYEKGTEFYESTMQRMEDNAIAISDNYTTMSRAEAYKSIMSSEGRYHYREAFVEYRRPTNGGEFETVKVFKYMRVGSQEEEVFNNLNESLKKAKWQGHPWDINRYTALLKELINHNL